MSRHRETACSTARPLFHIHFNSRRESHQVFHMTPHLIEAAAARHTDLAGKMEFTFSWDLEECTEALKTTSMLVTGVQVPLRNIGHVAPALEAIHFIGAGVEYHRPFDWVPKGVAIINNRGIHYQKAGEYILMCLLMLNSRIPALMNAQSRREWLPLFTGQLKGKTLVIVGVGHLGGAGAEAAKKCGLHVIGVRRSGRPHRHCHEVVGPNQLHAVLPRADFVVVTAPSTAQTDGMIGRSEFDLMKKTASFTNFSRAQLVDYEALAEKLRTGMLEGAVLDVFDPEPLPSDSDLWAIPNLLITPHCSSDDLTEYIPMTLDLVFRNVARAMSNRGLLNKVDLKREY